MGIQDRDYMKRPSPSDGSGSDSSPRPSENLLAKFQENHPRFFLHLGLGLLVLVVVALSLIKATGWGR